MLWMAHIVVLQLLRYTHQHSDAVSIHGEHFVGSEVGVIACGAWPCG